MLAKASALKVPPPDVTLLTRHNEGRFPRQRVVAFITVGEVALAPAHGNADMPVWGPVFRGLDPSDTLMKVRIDNVVDYVESIQAK